MKEHKYNISISAKTETEANEKMQALVALASKLSAAELSRLAHIVKHDPIKTALAKKYLGV
jgi:LPS O-antigen subunit length determinant protein (WzzB/FepE family)